MDHSDWGKSLTLCLVLRKCEGKKMDRKNIRKEQDKENLEKNFLFGCPWKSFKERKLNYSGTFQLFSHIF